MEEEKLRRIGNGDENRDACIVRKEKMGSKGRFEEADRLLKVGKSKGFWSSEEV
jgi:hypothetical protein